MVARRAGSIVASPKASWFAYVSLASLAIIAQPHGAAAQESGNALASAADAFGERVGIEQIGLYDEGQVRGFDLGNAGAYRIDGDYFARAGDVPDGVIEGVGVRVGVNAARLDYPAASGVVNYRLKTYAPGQALLSVTTGFRDQASPYMELDGRYGAKDGRWGVSGGFLGRPDLVYPDSTTGTYFSGGIVPEWRPSDALRVRGFAGLVRGSFEGGDYGYASAFGGLPAEVPQAGKRYFPDWARTHYNTDIAGLMIDAQPAKGWRLSGSAFYSAVNSDYDFTNLDVEPDLAAHATLFHMPGRTSRAASFEARAARSFRALGGDQQLSAAVRMRRARAATSQATEIDLGDIDLTTRPIYGPRPALPDRAPQAHDDVDQSTFSLGYAGVFGGRLELRGGVHRTLYDKRFTPVSGPSSEIDQAFWLAHASAVYQLDGRTAAFTSFVKGLEDSGVAPQTAVNRGQVLPPVEARQIELGLRRALTPDLSLIAAVFDVAKPAPGLRSDGVYSLVGDVRHRGVEVSINGQVTPSTRVLFGLMAMRPRISGPMVEAGLVGAIPPGISSVVAVAGVDQVLGFAPGWSLDGQLSWETARYADSADSFKTPDLTLLSLGARYRFDVDGHATVLRVAANNALGAHQWRAFPYGSMYITDPRTVRASLTMNFGS
jgi:iron complex outermembrane receptor protein